MNITQTTVQCIKISDAPGLDTITVFIEDIAPSQGQITIACYGEAWTAYWGGCGDKGVASYFCSANSGYLTDKLICQGCDCEFGLEAQENQENYLLRIVEAVQFVLREIAGAEEQS